MAIYLPVSRDEKPKKSREQTETGCIPNAGGKGMATICGIITCHPYFIHTEIKCQPIRKAFSGHNADDSKATSCSRNPALSHDFLFPGLGARKCRLPT